MRFRGDVEGLRAIAVLLVVLDHLEAPGFGGGFVGVDVFFVISGYLITGLLASEFARTSAADGRGSISIPGFYARRARRILPAALATIVAVVVAAGVLLNEIRVAQVRHDAVWAVLFGSNVNFIRQATDYFAQGLVSTSPFQHYWSLAVEEQFYLAWPLLVWVLPRRRLALVCLGLVAGAFALRLGIHRTTFNATAAYVLTPARMDALALGALVAVAAREPAWWPRVRRGAPWLLAASSAAVAAVWVRQGGLFGGDPVVQVWAFGPLAAGFAALLVLALDGEGTSRLSRALRNRTLRGAGKYSYGLYVLHYPIFLALEAAGFTSLALADATGSRLLGVLAFAGVAGAATLAAALLSWNLLEKPFLRWKDRVPYREPAAAGGSPLETVALSGSNR
jgi:peptidoglycan/LPS O-acetylase OafA/YrhL